MGLFETSALTYEETVERPVYGYLLHNDEQRIEILEKQPNISAKELSITITNNWKSFSEEKKNEYAERAKELNWKRLNEFEKSAHLEKLANKLKETSHENSEINDRQYKKSRYYSESDYDEQDSDEETSETDDCNIYTQESFKYDSSVLAQYSDPESIKKDLFNDPPERRASCDEQNHESYIQNNENSVSNTEYNNSSSDYDLLLNTEEDSEVDESNQCYLQGLIHTYKNHKKSQYNESTHTPYFHSEPWIQPSKENEDSIENEELVPIPSNDTSQCQSEVTFQKDLSVSEEIFPEHCSLLDIQLDTSSYQENILTDKLGKKSLEIQFSIKSYDKENENICVQENKKGKSTTPLQTRYNVNYAYHNEPNSYKSRSMQQFQQERYGLKVPVPCITACEHYKKVVKFDGKNKHGSQMRQTELTKSINEKWKQMIFSESIAKMDKERYEREREEYLTSQYECFLRSQEGIPLNEWL
ncbi:hypothetical protein RclHR1_02810019 [Rhizophagus clarus]|uniref:High mobility group box domain-containing protein n=1 Tax=Rhizophagus clarus TaxID=94130 RepID=A0A2Z6RIT4_9GLOM|nr:hypothetical protein RclHR1_02810019 [Rhizophagus clarus]GES74131.1 high mobility group box domain-containing protein [Rhizophagus clarus]